MLHTTWPRLILTFLAGYFVASNLNWAIAEVLLNPWAMPRFDGFMRVGEAAGGINIVKMVVGFLIPQFVAVLLAASLSKPAAWAPRAVYAGLLVGIAAFFGTYTFLSGWGNVNAEYGSTHIFGRSFNVNWSRCCVRGKPLTFAGSALCSPLELRRR